MQNTPFPQAVTVDRRDSNDRRNGVWRAFLYGNFRPRRRGSRRHVDNHLIWFDWHEPRVLFLSLGVLLLNCTDALFTLNLLNAGATEANAVMASMLSIGIDNFVISKIILTSLSLLALVVVARRKFIGWLTVEHLLQGFFAGYLLVIGYEIYLFWYVFDLDIIPTWLFSH